MGIDQWEWEGMGILCSGTPLIWTHIQTAQLFDTWYFTGAILTVNTVRISYGAFHGWVLWGPATSTFNTSDLIMAPPAASVMKRKLCTKFELRTVFIFLSCKHRRSTQADGNTRNIWWLWHLSYYSVVITSIIGSLVTFTNSRPFDLAKAQLVILAISNLPRPNLNFMHTFTLWVTVPWYRTDGRTECNTFA